MRVRGIGWMSEFPSGGGEPGMGSDERIAPEDERGLGRERGRSVAGGAHIGGGADPGDLSGHVSYVNEPPEPIIGRVGGGGGAVPLTEGGATSVGPASEGGSDTGPAGGAQAGGAANTGGVSGDSAEGL